jgi:hypothetical protein
MFAGCSGRARWDIFLRKWKAIGADKLSWQAFVAAKWSAASACASCVNVFAGGMIAWQADFKCLRFGLKLRTAP